MRIRVVEDEPLLADAVAVHLTRAGHAVDCVGRLDDADASLDATEFGLVILDLHLPDGRGLDLLMRAAQHAPSARRDRRASRCSRQPLTMSSPRPAARKRR